MCGLTFTYVPYHYEVYAFKY